MEREGESERNVCLFMTGPVLVHSSLVPCQPRAVVAPQLLPPCLARISSHLSARQSRGNRVTAMRAVVVWTVAGCGTRHGSMAVWTAVDIRPESASAESVHAYR